VTAGTAVLLEEGEPGVLAEIPGAAGSGASATSPAPTAAATAAAAGSEPVDYKRRDGAASSDAQC
jgi:hypothetical protein